MLVVELQFLTGRYHATPWGRNVNEGAAEWPPSPYRLVRALFDAWKRKRPDWPAEKVAPLLEALASKPPVISLPPANSAHTRSWLSSNSLDAQNKQMVFDAFVVLSPGSRVLLGWPAVDLDTASVSALNELLGLLNYLGRSESWVAAGVSPRSEAVPSNSTIWNCQPLDRSNPTSTPIPQDSQSSRPGAGSSWEAVRVACPVPSETYGAARPLRWLDALAMSTSELHKGKRDIPPALSQVMYRRPHPAFFVRPPSRAVTTGPPVNGVLYSIQGKLLPNVTKTVELAERVRSKLMGIHKRIAGGPERLSRNFSGKDAAGRPARDQRHSYYLPLDKDGDGHIDHMMVIGRDPLDAKERVALDRFQSIWQPDGKPDLTFVPVKWGDYKTLLEPSRIFISATPFVPPRHFRKGRGEYLDWLAGEVSREAIDHGLPAPERVIPIGALAGRLRTVRWLEFRRNRKGDDEKAGFGFRLEFTEPVAGPFALGYGAHFGLGLFIPATED